MIMKSGSDICLDVNFRSKWTVELDYDNAIIITHHDRHDHLKHHEQFDNTMNKDINQQLQR